ncbi:MAG: hypothetical protein LBS99_01095 [Clostridiales bacterium]|nr:hypothetical protein [Clostridiales bacterium]
MDKISIAGTTYKNVAVSFSAITVEYSKSGNACNITAKPQLNTSAITNGLIGSASVTLTAKLNSNSTVTFDGKTYKK